MKFYGTSNITISKSNPEKVVNPRTASGSTFHLSYNRIKKKKFGFFLKIASIYLLIFIFHCFNRTYYRNSPSSHGLQIKSEFVFKRLLSEKHLESDSSQLPQEELPSNENCDYIKSSREEWRRKTKEAKIEIVNRWLDEKRNQRSRRRDRAHG